MLRCSGANCQTGDRPHSQADRTGKTQHFEWTGLTNRPAALMPSPAACATAGPDVESFLRGKHTWQTAGSVALDSFKRLLHSLVGARRAGAGHFYQSRVGARPKRLVPLLRGPQSLRKVVGPACRKRGKLSHTTHRAVPRLSGASENALGKRSYGS